MLNRNDALALGTFAYLAFALGCLLACLGKHLLCAAAFPIVFLLFMVPIPSAVVHAIETFLQRSSADLAYLLLTLTGTPVLRQEQTLGLPGLVIVVAQECSGIRSTMVLLITSLLAGHLFLTCRWTKAALIFAIIPLGILRNTARIVTLAWLSLYVDPGIITGPLHTRGGPLFFMLSLLPFFLLLWVLRKTELRAAGPPNHLRIL